MAEALQDVADGKAQRICAPGQWVVWRDGDTVRYRILKPSEETARGT